MTRTEQLSGLLSTVDAALSAAEPREIAALSREKRMILAELDSLAGLSKGSKVDELAQRRASRRSKAKVVDPPEGRPVQRRKRSS